MPNYALAVSNENIGPGQTIGEESLTCNGPCVLYPTAPKSLPVTVQIVSIPSNAPQLTGITFNIEANAAHAPGYQGLFGPCAVVPQGNPYTYSGGGETYTITQSATESTSGLCGIDIYDQYDDYVYIELQAQD